MFACPWQNNYPSSHWPHLPLNGECGSDNRQMTHLFSDNTRSETSSCLLDGCRVLSLFLPNVRLKSVVLLPSVCLVSTRRCSTAAESRRPGLSVGLYRRSRSLVRHPNINAQPSGSSFKATSQPLWDLKKFKEKRASRSPFFFTQDYKQKRSNGLEYPRREPDRRVEEQQWDGRHVLRVLDNVCENNTEVHLYIKKLSLSFVLNQVNSRSNLCVHIVCTLKMMLILEWCGLVVNLGCRVKALLFESGLATEVLKVQKQNFNLLWVKINKMMT